MSTIRKINVDLTTTTATFTGGLEHAKGKLEVFGMSMKETRVAGHLLG